MTPQDFCLWLDGFFTSFFGHSNNGVLSIEGVEAIRKQLKLVSVAFPKFSNEEISNIIASMNNRPYPPLYPQDHPPKVYGSALACNHANETPVKCPCDPDCYCKAHSCIENSHHNVY
jgi:hypothetical protein